MGEWQRIFVGELNKRGLSFEHAMIAMGLACDQRQASYMEGYEKGFQDGINFSAEKQSKMKFPPEIKEKLTDFISHQKDVPPEISEMVDEHFWDLI